MYFSNAYIEYLKVKSKEVSLINLNKAHSEITDVLADLFPFEDDEAIKNCLVQMCLKMEPFDLFLVGYGQPPELSKWQSSIFFEEAKPLMVDSVKRAFKDLQESEKSGSLNIASFHKHITDIHAAINAFCKFFKLDVQEIRGR